MHWIGGMEGHWLGMTLWLVLLAGVLFLIGRAWWRSDPGYSNEDSSLEILRKRFAKGVISQNEFEQSQKALLNSYQSKEIQS